MTASPLYIRVHPDDNVAIVVNDGGLPEGATFADGLTLREGVPQGHKVALADLADVLEKLGGERDAEKVQNEVYEVGKRHPFAELRAWFSCLYQVLLGQQEGPRFGGFVALYGIPETIALVRSALIRQANAA